jgi:peptide/nickel transport system substrate-binding protein
VETVEKNMTRFRTHRRRPRGLTVSLAAAALLALLAAGCASGSGSSGTSGAPQSGGTLNIALDSDPVCVDPTQTGLIASILIGSNIVNTLLVQDPTTGKIESGLASSYTENASATSFSFSLRSGVTFSNGQALNAQAVKTYFDGTFALGAKAPDPAEYLVGYSGTKVTGPLSFTITFKSGNAQFLTALTTTSLGILAPATVKASLADRCAGKDLYGTGPFALQSYTPNESVVLTRRQGFDWSSAEATLAKHTGPAYLSTIKFNIEPDSSVRAGSLRSGQVDLATLIAPQDEATFEGHGFSILSRINSGVVFGIAPNLKGSAILQDAQVRQAIQLGINRQEITDTLSPSYGVADSVLGSATIGYTNLSADLAPNVAKAESILSADGWKPGANGIREKDGKELSLSVLYFYDPNVIQVLQQQLRAIGVNLQLDLVTAAQYESELPAGNYDFAMVALAHQDPDVLRSEFSTTTGDNRAWLSASDPDVATFDQIEQQQLETSDLAARLKDAAEGQQILLQNNYFYPLAQLAQVAGVSDKLTGVEYSAAGYLNFYNAALAG